MTWISRLFHQVGENLPLCVHRLMIKRDFIVINYHMVSEKTPPHVINLFPFKSPEMFERDLDYLQHNFRLVSYDQLVDHLSGAKKLPPRAVAITFDDGFAECYQVVRPLLLNRGIPCTFFVNTNYIDNRDMADAQKASLCIDQILLRDEKYIGELYQTLQESFGYGISDKSELITSITSTGTYDRALIEKLGYLLGINFDKYLGDHTPYLTTAQIQTMNSEGFIIGSHGVEHIRYSSLTEVEIENSIANSCCKISLITGRQPVPFAFPHNADGVSREFLNNILSKNPHVGLLFDTNGIQQQESFLVSRLNGDRPFSDNEAYSNLKILIKRAFIEDIARHIYK